TAEHPQLLQFLLREKQLLPARSRSAQIDRRENSPLRQSPIQMHFQVSGPLKLFVNHVIHPGTRLHQRRSQNGETSALFDVSGCSEKSLGAVKGGGIDSSGKGPPA